MSYYQVAVLVAVLLVISGCPLASQWDRRGGRAASWAPVLLGLLWTLAIGIVLAGWRIDAGDDRGWLWPDDFWQRGFWSALLAAVVLGVTAAECCRSAPQRWVAAGLLAMLAAYLALPGGEGWEDTEPLHGGWMLLIGSVMLLGLWSVDRLAHREADRWFPLVLVALLAGPLYVAATTYSALAQWAAGAMAATAAAVPLALAGRLPARVAVGIAYPAVVLAMALAAAGRFYSFEQHAWPTYLGLLLVAPLVAAIDCRIASRGSWWRASVAALVSVASIGLSVLCQGIGAD